MPFQTITKLLNLPNFKVFGMFEPNETSIYLYLDMVEPVAPVCSGCKKVHHSPARSIGWILAEDLPLSGRRVFLYVSKRKVRCLENGKIRAGQFNWLRIYQWLHEWCNVLVLHSLQYK